MVLFIFLWISLLFYSFYFAGHLFDLLANVPNWKSGNPDEVARYRDFYHKRSPKNYFLFLVLGTPLVTLVSLILASFDLKIEWLYTGIAFLLSVVVLIFTLRAFLPINQYIFGSTSYNEPEKLKKLVAKWIRFDYIRISLIGIGLLAAIMALHNSYIIH